MVFSPGLVSAGAFSSLLVCDEAVALSGQAVIKLEEIRASGLYSRKVCDEKFRDSGIRENTSSEYWRLYRVEKLSCFDAGSDQGCSRSCPSSVAQSVIDEAESMPALLSRTRSCRLP